MPSFNGDCGSSPLLSAFINLKHFTWRSVAMKIGTVGAVLLLGSALQAMAAEGDPVWLPSYEQGIAAAADTGKPIFLVFR